MRDIYNYMPETNRVYKVYSVVLQSVLHVVLFRVLNMSCTLRQYVSQYVCSAQHRCLLQFFNFVLSRNVTQVLTE